MLALLVLEYLRSHIAELNAPNYMYANHTQNVLRHLASYELGFKAETELSRYFDDNIRRFDLAFLNGTDKPPVTLMEDEDISSRFLEEELPKLALAKAKLKVGVTYDSVPEIRINIVEKTEEAIRQQKGEGMFLLILGYAQDTKKDEPFMRLDGFLYDNEGNLVWKNIDHCNRRVNLLPSCC